MIGYALALSVPERGFEQLRRQVQTIVDDEHDAARPGGFAVAVDEPDDDSRAYLRRALDAEPTADLWFSVDDRAAYDDFLDAERRTLSLAIKIASQTDATACLTFETGGVMMRRRAGVVVLYRSWAQWADPDLLDRIDVPFVMSDEHEAW